MAGPRSGGRPVAIHPIGIAEEPAAAEALALAFYDQPLDRAVVGGSPQRRLRAERAGMRGTLESARGRADVRIARAAAAGGVDGVAGAAGSSEVAGVLVALPPWVHPLPPPGLLSQARTLWAQGFAVAGRWRELFEMLGAHHPPEPVWHLSLLGVAPAAQGSGVGSALMQDWLPTVDAAGEPAWLETARAENVPFYTRYGFEVVGELAWADVPIWLMHRPAVGARG